jgi:hypothetical protein
VSLLSLLHFNFLFKVMKLKWLFDFSWLATRELLFIHRRPNSNLCL